MITFYFQTHVIATSVRDFDYKIKRSNHQVTSLNDDINFLKIQRAALHKKMATEEEIHELESESTFRRDPKQSTEDYVTQKKQIFDLNVKIFEEKLTKLAAKIVTKTGTLERVERDKILADKQKNCYETIYLLTIATLSLPDVHFDISCVVALKEELLKIIGTNKLPILMLQEDEDVSDVQKFDATQAFVNSLQLPVEGFATPECLASLSSSSDVSVDKCEGSLEMSDKVCDEDIVRLLEVISDEPLRKKIQNLIRSKDITYEWFRDLELLATPGKIVAAAVFNEFTLLLHSMLTTSCEVKNVLITKCVPYSQMHDMNFIEEVKARQLKSSFVTIFIPFFEGDMMMLGMYAASTLQLVAIGEGPSKYSLYLESLISLLKRHGVFTYIPNCRIRVIKCDSVNGRDSAVVMMRVLVGLIKQGASFLDFTFDQNDVRKMRLIALEGILAGKLCVFDQ